jgi:hypothetical protein
MVLHSDNDIPDDVTPRPLDELFEQTEIPPPPEIQLAPLVLKTIWDSDMLIKFLDDVTGRKKWRCGHCGQEWFDHNATKSLGHVVGIVKDIKACRGTIPPRYKDAYLNFYRSKYDSKAFKAHSIAKMHASLNTTDNHTLTSLLKRGLKRTVDTAIDLTVHSPITNSVTTATLSCSTSNKKQRKTFQQHFPISSTTIMDPAAVPMLLGLPMLPLLLSHWQTHSPSEQENASFPQVHSCSPTVWC